MVSKLSLKAILKFVAHSTQAVSDRIIYNNKREDQLEAIQRYKYLNGFS